MWFANISSCNLLRNGAAKLPQTLLENLPSVTGHQREVEGQKCKTEQFLSIICLFIVGNYLSGKKQNHD